MTSSDGSASVIRKKPLWRSLWPLLIWVVLVGPILGYRYHAKLVRETTLIFSVTVEGKPAGLNSFVTLDGKRYQSGQQCKRGPRVLVVQAPDTEPVTREVRVQYGTNHLGLIDLKRMRGGLRIQVDPAPREIQIDGPSGREVIRSDRATLPSLLIGEYRIQAVFDHFKEERRVLVQHKETAEVTMTANAGTVQITSDPANSQFQITSRLAGQQNLRGNTPTTYLLPVGEYTLKAWRGDYSKEMPVHVSRGTTNDARMRFEYGIVQINTTPPGATVYMNRKQAGKSPLELSGLRPGDYQFRLELPDHVPIQLQCSVEGDRRFTVSTNLVNRRYASAMDEARRRAEGFRPNYETALASVGEALKVYPEDQPAKELQAKIQVLIEEQQTRLAAEREQAKLAAQQQAAAREEARVKAAQSAQDAKLARITNLFESISKRDTDSALFDVHSWTYQTDMGRARRAMQNTFNELSASWKLQSESREGGTSYLYRALQGGGGGGPGHCIVLLSPVSSAEVIVQARFCDYALNTKLGLKVVFAKDSEKYIPIHPDYYSTDKPEKAAARRKASADGFQKWFTRYLKYPK